MAYKRCRHRGRGCIFPRAGLDGRFWLWCAQCGALQKLKKGDGPTTLIPDGKPHTLAPGASDKRYMDFWRVE